MIPKVTKNGIKIGDVLNVLFISILIISIIAGIRTVSSVDGASTNFLENSTKNLTIPSNYSGGKGYIHTINLDTSQQDYKWKAYIGNVSGTLVLEDSAGYSIYDWAIIGNSSGEVFVSRGNSVFWTTINCSNESSVADEQSAMSMSDIMVDNINNTFNHTVHNSMLIGAINITNSTCKSLFTNINDSRDGSGLAETSPFQEILLQDNQSTVVYATFIEDAQMGYNQDKTHQFQLLVAENATLSAPDITYYFYVELD